jgi:hypothetical protein
VPVAAATVLALTAAAFTPRLPLSPAAASGVQPSEPGRRTEQCEVALAAIAGLDGVGPEFQVLNASAVDSPEQALVTELGLLAIPNYPR